MRQIGKLETQEKAERFVDYLLTLEIDAKTDPSKDQWVIWILNENHLEQAKSELEAFRSNPEEGRYLESASEAAAIRKLEHLKNEERKKNIHDMRGKFSQGGTGGIGPAVITKVMILISVGVMLVSFLFLRTNNGDPGWGAYIYSYTLFVSPLDRDAALAQKDPLITIKKGEVWRIITPIFAHDLRSPFHLIFNMYWMYVLGSRLETYAGSTKYLIFLLCFALAANLAEAYCQIYIDHRYAGFVGMSGVNYGLFGYLWMKTRYEPEPLTYLQSSTIFIMVLWFIACWTGVIGSVANYAHTGGLVAGVLAGGWKHWIGR